MRLCVGSSAPALSVSPAAPGLPSSPDSLALRNAPKLVLDTDFPTEKPGILLGFIALGGALVGLLGVKIREALAHRRGAGGDRGQGEEAGWGQDREGQAESGVVATEPVAAALASEEGLREQQAKIEELENQLAVSGFHEGSEHYEQYIPSLSRRLARVGVGGSVPLLAFLF